MQTPVDGTCYQPPIWWLWWYGYQQEMQRYQREICSLRSKNRELVETIVSHSLVWKDCARRLMINVSTQDKYSFVVVLVDIERTQFQDDLLQDPQGGYEAARRLEEGVKDYLASTPLAQSSVPVLVRIFADSDKLARTLHSTKVTESETAMRIFCKQLTANKLYVDFVDASDEKGNANPKTFKG